MTNLKYDTHRLQAVMLSRLGHVVDRKPVNTSKATRKRVSVPVKRLGLATGQVVRVRVIKRVKIPVRYEE